MFLGRRISTDARAMIGGSQRAECDRFFWGSLKDVPAVQLGSLVIKETLKRVGLRPRRAENWLDVGRMR